MREEKSKSDDRIGIVTVTYNSAAVLPDFFESLEQQTYKNFVVYAVDSGSSDSSVSALQEQPKSSFKVIKNVENVGIAKGNNQGISAALNDGCSAVLLLNNDVVFGPDFILRLLEGLKAHSCSMAVPLIYFHDSPRRIWAVGGGFQALLGQQPFHRGEGEEDNGQYNQTVAIDFAPACCILIKRDVFERIGIMDERFFVYSEDVDFMYRASKANLSTCVIPSAKLWHKVHALTGGESDFTYFYGARGRALFLYKHLPNSALMWLALHAAFDFSRAVFRESFRHPCKVKWEGMKAGRKVALNSHQQSCDFE